MRNANLQPPYYAVVFYLPRGLDMFLGQEIEQIRIKRGISVFCICNTLNMSETEYMHFVSRGKKLSNYQMIMFMDETRHGLYTI